MFEPFNHALTQVVFNEENLSEAQAEYDGPGEAGGCEGVLPCASCFGAEQRGGLFQKPVRVLNKPCTDGLCMQAVGTPYEGGLFRMKLVLGTDFPKAPPKGARACPAQHSGPLACLCST